MKVPGHILFRRVSIFRLLLAGSLIAFFIGVSAPETNAQEKSKYERVNKKKNKQNRRLQRRGDKGKSNKRSVRNTRYKIKSKQGERAYKGDITGRKFQGKRSQRPKWGAAAAKANPYAGRKRTSEASRAKALKQTPRYSSRQRERAWKGGAGRAINMQSRRITFTGKQAYQQKSIRSATRDPERPRKITRVVPRSASGAYRVRKRKKPYVFRERSKWEHAYQGDITGKKFRSKGASERPGIKRAPSVKYTGSGGRRGDRAYSGKFKFGYQSASKKRERAWKNDISGNKLRVRSSEKPKFTGNQFKTYPKGKRKGDAPYRGRIKGGDYRSISSRKERAGSKSPSSKAPGAGTVKAWRFQGNIKSGRPQKGGGSISGKRWNNNGRAIEGRGLRSQDSRIAKFQGNAKGRRIQKGGGSISGKLWNNKGKAVQGRQPRTQDSNIARFQGNLKGGKIYKGGGSISGKLWNNKGKAIQGRAPRRQDDNIARFQGNVKGGKINKGGGSISGKLWNNKGKAIQGRAPRRQDENIVRFQGNVKGGKVLKGGGSISGRLWNNKGKAIAGRQPRSQDNKINKFQGNLKGGKIYKGGGSISGKLWNNNEKPIKNRGPRMQDERVVRFQGNIKAGKTDKAKQSSRKAASYRGKIPGYMIQKGPDDTHRYQGNIKQFKYKKNKRAHDEALKAKAPGKGYSKGGKYQGDLKVDWKYKRRPNAADGAAKGIGPSRATIQASNYQGNIKMKRKRIEDRHPDFKYLAKSSNGKSEKDKAFSFKLFWSKLFKKQENQPDHLKEKQRKPRYDKGEEGLWND